jgi:hypothetical protein
LPAQPTCIAMMTAAKCPSDFSENDLIEIPSRSELSTSLERFGRLSIDVVNS